jgi:Asp-tRNA(Asn)/Glu-tRNA(Gln) amidotransferase A subunit family amidase
VVPSASRRGIYGHKPTLDLISQKGHSPGGASLPVGFSVILPVVGPLARSANDLLAALRVLGGPTDGDVKAWKWEMPPPRARRLKDFRVGYVLDGPIAPPTAEVMALLDNAVESLRRAGATLKPGWPAGFQPEELLKNYRFHLDAIIFSVASPEEQERMRKTYERQARPPREHWRHLPIGKNKTSAVWRFVHNGRRTLIKWMFFCRRWHSVQHFLTTIVNRQGSA